MTEVRTREGEVFLPRNHPEAERVLDALFYRLRPGRLRWVNVPKTSLGPSVSDDPLHVPPRVVLMGKGPSVDVWVQDNARRRDHPIFAVNEAIMVEGMGSDGFFAIDGPVVDRLFKIWPSVRYVQPILSAGAALRWHHEERDRKPRIFVPEKGARYTAAAAVKVLAQWGASEILMVGFDGMHVHTGPAYADYLVSRGVPQRPSSDFRIHTKAINKAAEAGRVSLIHYHRGEDFDDA